MLLETLASQIGSIVARKRAMDDLRNLTARYDAILGAVPDIIMEVDADKVYTWANRAGLDFFGDDVIGREARHYFAEEQDTYQRMMPLFAGEERVVYVESLQRRRDGEHRLLGWWCRALKDGAGREIGMLSSARDLTEIKTLEEHLMQARKMDAIGQLAGGVALHLNYTCRR